MRSEAASLCLSTGEAPSKSGTFPSEFAQPSPRVCNFSQRFLSKAATVTEGLSEHFAAAVRVLEKLGLVPFAAAGYYCLLFRLRVDSPPRH